MTNTLYPNIQNRSYSKTSGYKVGIGFCMEDYCEKTMFNSVLETHHIVPKINGGLDIYENYIILCRKCHQKQSKMLFRLTKDQLIEEMDRLMDIKIKYEIEIFNMTSFNICNRDFSKLLLNRRKKIEIVNNIDLSEKAHQNGLNKPRDVLDKPILFNVEEEFCVNNTGETYYIRNRDYLLRYARKYYKRPEVKKKKKEYDKWRKENNIRREYYKEYQKRPEVIIKRKNRSILQ